MLFRFLTSGKGKVQGKSYLLAVAATGCFGAGLLVALADAGQDNSSSGSDEAVSAGNSRKQKVVILGTGWGGVSFLKNLDSSKYDVRVVSPRNYFVFTPLLPSVTSGTVEARSITEPIRRIIRKKDVKFHEAECTKIDAANKKVVCRDSSDVKCVGKEEFELEYDYLVVAVGATSNTFGTKGVEEYCHFLKEIEDAEKIRGRIVDCFETASLPHLSDEDRRKLLSFVIVGGGPTGVEYAAELHDLIHEDLTGLYPELQKIVKITVVQSGDHILNTFDGRISEYAEKKFAREGIDVKIGSRVLGVSDESITFKSKATGNLVEMPYGMIVWSTGIGTRPVVADYMKQIGQTDRRVLATDEWLRVKNAEGVYALGDCATIEQRKIAEDIAYLFKLADKNGDGTLSVSEFVDTMNNVRVRYPQIDLYMERQHMKGVVGLLNDAIKKEKDLKLDLDHFSEAICKVDSQMKSTPATAQVAAQQGDYLARSFNHLATEDPDEGPMRIRGGGRHRCQPFLYRHLGQFAPLGGETTAAELPGDWVSIGRSTQWLWYSVYASKQVSWRTRALVIFDWTKRFVFGRDSSRM
jgi:NADH:ubiquinone reductase (non-electrogenic)